MKNIEYLRKIFKKKKENTKESLPKTSPSSIFII